MLLRPSGNLSSTANYDCLPLSMIYLFFVNDDFKLIRVLNIYEVVENSILMEAYAVSCITEWRMSSSFSLLYKSPCWHIGCTFLFTLLFLDTIYMWLFCVLQCAASKF